MINISGLDKVKVLKALYDSAIITGELANTSTAPLSMEDAQLNINRGFFISYINNKEININLEPDIIDEIYYDRANGIGSAKSAINKIRGK